MNNIQEKCLRLIRNDYDSNFNEILESSHELSIHKTCINHLMIEVYKYLHGLSAELMTAVLLFGKILTTFAKFVYVALKIHGHCVLKWMELRFVQVSCGKKYP